MEIIEKLLFGCIVCLKVFEFFLDHDFTTNYYPGFLKNYFMRQFPWMFTTLYLADRFCL